MPGRQRRAAPVSVLTPPMDPADIIDEAVSEMSDVEVECRNEHDWPPKWNRRMVDDRTTGEQRKKCRRCKAVKRQWVNVLTGHIIRVFPYDYSEAPDYVKRKVGHTLQTTNGRAAIRVRSWHNSGFGIQVNGRKATDDA